MNAGSSKSFIDATDTHQRLADRPGRSRKPVGVIQERSGLLIAHDAMRFLMHEAAVHHGLDPNRRSFVHALQVILALFLSLFVLPQRLF
jgi:hypothetical protein